MCVCRSQQQLPDQVFLHIKVKQDLQALFFTNSSKILQTEQQNCEQLFHFFTPPLEEGADQQDERHTPHGEADADILYDVNRCAHFCRCTVV